MEVTATTQRMGAKVYMDNLRDEGRKKGQPEAKKEFQLGKPVVPGAEYLATIPHAPWPSRAMLKRRIVLGTPELIVKNGVTRVFYPSGAVYEGEVKDGKRHGNGMYKWTEGDSYQGMWYMGLPHGLGVAEYASGAAYVGEWYLGDRSGNGMYFFAPHPDEPHKEYAGQWREDMMHGSGKRLSKDGTVYLGGWRKGMRHGDGICRVARDSFFNPLGAAANLVRRTRNTGATGRFGELDAKQKHEVDVEQLMGGIKDWHAEEMGIVVQEGRFVHDEYEPRDRGEIKAKKMRLKRQAKEEEKSGRPGTGESMEDDDATAEELAEENSKAAMKSRKRLQRLRALAKREGRPLAAKDFPEDEVDVEIFEPFVQAAMEVSDASELVGKKIRAKYHKVNFNFRVHKYEGQVA
mmetsp:Transcript_11615/g.23306  ORF Transcript_11615/g.23306 Transcript_11615/m.23306 type:complete len:405 (+) Transcript_11615:63-1277(+)